MKLSEVWKTYEFYTENLTDHSRKLAFAIAAICWFFKTPEVTFPPSILWSLIFVVLFLLLDVFQYLIGALLTGGWARQAEKKMHKTTGKVEGDVDKPAWLDKPVKGLFLLKNFSLMLSGWFLLAEFVNRLSK